MEDLLAEKKNTFIQLQKTIDDCDTAKGNSEQFRKELADTKSLLNKRQNELQLLRGLYLHFPTASNFLKTVD